jgi:hypothetical protein
VADYERKQLEKQCQPFMNVAQYQALTDDEKFEYMSNRRAQYFKMIEALELPGTY